MVQRVSDFPPRITKYRLPSGEVDNFECTLCPYASLDKSRYEKHVLDRHVAFEQPKAPEPSIILDPEGHPFLKERT